VTKTNKEVPKTGKEVGKAIDTLLGEPKKEKSHTTQVRQGQEPVNLDCHVQCDAMREHDAYAVWSEDVMSTAGGHHLVVGCALSMC
jgi:ubiquitin